MHSWLQFRASSDQTMQTFSTESALSVQHRSYDQTPHNLMKPSAPEDASMDPSEEKAKLMILSAIVIQLPESSQLSLPLTSWNSAHVLSNNVNVSLPVEKNRETLTIKIPKNIHQDHIPVLKFQS